MGWVARVIIILFVNPKIKWRPQRVVFFVIIVIHCIGISIREGQISSIALSLFCSEVSVVFVGVIMSFVSFVFIISFTMCTNFSRSLTTATILLH